ncbi:MAG: hypothetical protein CVV24_01775 [Ignavibacteriae bacterium HGW-Ignavibacteriae-3]|nr:MAG: hypothetical protein CVV24_01775 [Ignavibacteriae bacterium HGW-Ignavibacteriae-3]
MQNGKKYFKVVPIQPDPSYIFSNYIRIDSATANVYYYNTFANYEGIIDTLAAQPGDSYSVVFSAGNPASPHQFSVVCLQIDTVNLFNTLTDVKKFYIPIVDNKRWYNYAKGIGNIYNKVSIVWIIGYDLIYDLVYAKINGKEYGTFVGVKGNDMIPGSYSLSQNYPNPFNPITKIRYSLPAAGFVSLKVYDLVGQEIHMLVNEEKPAGSFEVSFDGKNLASGVYFYKLSSGSFTQTKKFILMR